MHNSTVTIHIINFSCLLQAKTLLNEYDEVIPKSLKEAKGSTIVHKDNLVSSDTVYIDPYHLVGLHSPVMIG